MHQIVRLFVVMTCILAGAATARAETLTFMMSSDHPEILRLEFASQNRNVYWPGDGKSWTMEDYDVHAYKLNCRRGEKICYGAWTEDFSSSWGVGYQNGNRCQNCCYTCNGGTTKVINLTP